MPRDEQQPPEPEQQKSWAEWKAELHEAIEELDKACAHARQVIYRLRPLVRPKQRKQDNESQGEERQPVSMPEKRGRHRGRPRE
jgi:hypothetical protein